MAHIISAELRKMAKTLQKGAVIYPGSLEIQALHAAAGCIERQKAPQDMNLRELFDHVAIVNDAIRTALLSHPSMPPAREG